MAPHQMTQREYRVVEVLGIEYYVEWETLQIGSSFFIPTTVTAKMVSSVLREYERKLGYKLETRNRNEYGRYGVRVWRVN